MRVKVVKYKNGYVITVSIDPHKKRVAKLPVKIFHENKIIDPFIFVLSEEGISGATNKIFVRKSDVNKIIDEIKEFYKKYGEYKGLDIHVNVIEIDPGLDDKEVNTTIEKFTLKKKQKIEEITILDIVRSKLSQNTGEPQTIDGANTTTVETTIPQNTGEPQTISAPLIKTTIGYAEISGLPEV